MLLSEVRGNSVRRRGENFNQSPNKRSVEISEIATAPRRQRITVQGKVVRIQSRPLSALPTFSISIDDSTALAIVSFTGRRTIGGLGLGRQIQVTGVAVDTGGMLTFVNPEYRLVS